jgi:hypothetical protein
LAGLLPDSGSSSSGGALPNSLDEGAVLSTFSVEKGGAGAVLDKSIQLQLLRRSPWKGALPNTPLVIVSISKKNEISRLF